MGGVGLNLSWPSGRGGREDEEAKTWKEELCVVFFFTLV